VGNLEVRITLNALIAASGLTPETFAIAASMTFGAAYVRGLTGFGMAIILVPLLGMIIAPGQAVILAIFLQLLIGPVGIRGSIDRAEKPSSVIIAGFAVLATPLGLWLLSVTPQDIARLLIAGIAILAFVLVVMPKSAHGRPAMPVTVATGLTAGVLTGFAAMPGPPVVPYYLQDEVSPHAARASMMVIFFSTAIAGSISAVAGGYASTALAALSLLLFLPMLAGNWLGGKAFGRVSPPLWRSGVAVLLGIAAASAIWRAAG
jgi:uncharacterized protein